ncbi:MAG TPA: putative glycoside hydrolase, partial [bacterium]|nr:putative glycoside hydrolase [bacterium]
MAMIGAFCFPDTFRRPAADRDSAIWLERIAGYGVNAIFTEAETYDDAWIELAHSFGLRWFAGVACFSDHANQNRAVRERPELWPVTETGRRRRPMEWYVGITPTYEDYAEARLDLIARLAAQHAFDGFMLDFVRWPLHWELECRPGAQPQQASFDPHTLQRFQEFAGRAISGRTAALKAARILAEMRDRWIDFKCHVINAFVAEAVARLKAARHSLMTGLYVLPLDSAAQEALAGQRVADLAALVDYIAPMAYHAILHQPPEWAERIARQAAGVAPRRTLPVLQVDSREGPPVGADWGPPIRPAEWEEVAGRVLRVPGVCGCVAFTGTALAYEDRGDRLSRLVRTAKASFR